MLVILIIRSVTSSMEFTKHDDGKPRRSYFDPELIELLYKVSMHGAKKYAVHNWKKCEERFRYFDAADRHMTAYQRGEWGDEESQLPHLAHAAWNILAEIAICKKLFIEGLNKISDEIEEKEKEDAKKKETKRSRKGSPRKTFRVTR